MLVSSIFFSTVLALLLLLRRYYEFISRRLFGNPNKKTGGKPKVENVNSVEEIIPLLNFDIHTTEPRPYRPWSSGKFAMTMGIRKLPENDLFLLDKEYVEQQKFRRYLLTEKREGVMQCLPGSEDACAETLDYVVNFLTEKYPRLFVPVPEKPGYLHNCITDLTFKISKPYEMHPLEVAAQLVMEDLNILMQGAGDDPEQHYLIASFSMAPAGWYIQERIGWPLWKIHGPVPLWEERLRKSIERSFANMKASAPIQRNNFFLQTTAEIFQQEPFESSLEKPPVIQDLNIRHERQTLRRLPKSNGILFCVRTFFTPVTDLEAEPESLRALVDSALAMPEEMAKYKCRQVWMDTLQEWASTVLGVDMDVETGKGEADDNRDK